ncbi:ATP-dependent helicase [Pelagicoccus sp. NFK12]|uniref:ATP-dependent helicase n=1 Tax=Pelagicoccus enzymogenes TaxID=2773457 RepID=A0A927IGQ5_9BACT|nr:DEAD/DEAH box helicase [Pelagicoccus enzymogenes]MBD5779054.1 ATP-dependent helicase [Pelagicoccus enzymogenes]
MRLRIILPPNIESAAPRDAIPTKLEIALANGQAVRPETLTPDKLGELDEAGRVAAFSLFQWCGGKLSSFLQLDREKLTTLVTTLAGQDDFYWANKPQDPIAWNGSELIGVTEHLEPPPPPTSPSSTSSSSSSSPSRREADEEGEAEAEFTFTGAPMTVDGSSHYLAISLPSREHPYYEEIRELLQTYRFKLEPGNRKWWLRDRHLTLNFLGEYWGELEDRYQAEFTANFQQRVGKIPEAKIKTEVMEERNGYNLTVSITAGQASQQEISQSLNTGKRYIESGEKVFLIKRSRLDTLNAVQKQLTGDFNAPLLHNGSYKIPYSRSLEIEEPLSELNPNFEPPSTWRTRSEALKRLDKLQAPKLSDSLDAILRPYQKTGVAWLHHLYQNKLGGILADEMGLGKTLQALAFLSSIKGGTAAPRASTSSGGTAVGASLCRRERSSVPRASTSSLPPGGTAAPRASTPSHSRQPSSLPSLVVCPASLVENWRREAAKFTPELKVFVNQGSTRIKTPEQAQAYDLVITSYGTLIRDKKRFADINFLCVIADEAQHIKNRRTQNAKALTALQTDGRILLTGTPIENSIQDLMSLLDFIMPGGWKPIPNGARGDERRWHERRILDQAAPYILRRTKDKVATELPEKIEQVLFLEMTPAQKKTYEAARQHAEKEISQLEKSGASEGALRMKTLTQLLRLRQTCCDPRLLDEKLEPSASTKLNSFLELLEESSDGGHRILVFSQFVSLLSILKEELDSQNVPYCYIDGSTRNRMAEVDRFNESDDIPIFLISLKAGGTGLNLTAADTVVHFDPWWNPAAEAQATDRAHRIGQTKVVTSYKLIVSDSVEEKVLQLQNQKRQLLADVFEASEAANAKITLQDLKELI